MEAFGIILIALLLTSLYVIRNILKKLEKYEEFIEIETQRNQALLEALREIDSREMFEKDDEVGSIFYQIKETIERFKQFN
jgi:predicted transcriptional regulator